MERMIKMERIGLRLEPQLREQAEKLIQEGKFKNLSEIVRQALTEFFSARMLHDVLRLLDALYSLGVIEREEVDRSANLPYILRYTIPIKNKEYIERESVEKLMNFFAKLHPNSAISWDIDMNEKELLIWVDNSENEGEKR
jgi:Arc/MetJ-type ribon-helix-helix transcriptional regulator